MIYEFFYVVGWHRSWAMRRYIGERSFVWEPIGDESRPADAE